MLYLFVGIDRTRKFAVTQLVEKSDRKTAWEFLEHLLKAVPYRIHTILTDNVLARVFGAYRLFAFVTKTGMTTDVFFQPHRRLRAVA